MADATENSIALRTLTDRELAALIAGPRWFMDDSMRALALAEMARRFPMLLAA